MWGKKQKCVNFITWKYFQNKFNTWLTEKCLIIQLFIVIFFPSHNFLVQFISCQFFVRISKFGTPILGHKRFKRLYIDFGQPIWFFHKNCFLFNAMLHKQQTPCCWTILLSQESRTKTMTTTQCSHFWNISNELF